MATLEILHACKDGTFLDLKTGNVYAYATPPTPTPTPMRVQMRESGSAVQAAVKAPQKPASVPTTKPKPKARPRSIAPSPSALGFLRAECAWLQHEPIEHTIVFPLTESGDICGVQRIAGEAARVDFDGAPVVREAVKHGAVSTILLHNHPHRMGAEPSSGDDHATDTLRAGFAAESIGLFDHFIIAKSGHVHSYRESAMEPESLYEQRDREDRRLWAAYGGRRPF